MRAFISSLLLILHLQASATDLLYPSQVNQLFTEVPRLVVFWSVDCPPCYKELSMLEKLLKDHPNLPITLVATDDDTARYSEVESMHQRLVGQELKKWVFADLKASEIRFSIDQSWSGVLPRSYFIDTRGKRIGHSGLLKVSQVLDWYNIQKLGH
jgi:thiol-disulfide isomerase/thioredoxin